MDTPKMRFGAWKIEGKSSDLRSERGEARISYLGFGGAKKIPYTPKKARKTAGKAMSSRRTLGDHLKKRHRSPLSKPPESETRWGGGKTEILSKAHVTGRQC